VSPGAHPRSSLSEPCKPICAFKARTPLVAQARRGPISEQSSQAVVRRGKRLPRQTRTLTRAKGAPSHPIAWGQRVIPSVASNPPIRGGPEQTSSPRQCALHRDRNPQPTTHNTTRFSPTHIDREHAVLSCHCILTATDATLTASPALKSPVAQPRMTNYSS
jgi:hypothetical protein